MSIPTLEGQCSVEPIRIGVRKLCDRRALDRWVDGLAHDGAPMTAEDWLGRLDADDSRQAPLPVGDIDAQEAAWIERRGRLAAWRAAGRPLPGGKGRKKPPSAS